MDVTITNWSELAAAIIQAMEQSMELLGNMLVSCFGDLGGLFLGLIPLIPLMFLSILAFWKPHALLFLLVAGISMIVGLNWYDSFTNTTGLSISIMLIAFAFVNFGYAIKVLVWKD